MKKFHASTTWQNRHRFERSNRTSVDAFLLWRFLQFFNAAQVLEIGFSEGYTAGFMMEASPDDARFDFLDITFDNAKIFNILENSKPYELIECDSQLWNWNRWYEFISVDGEHSYEFARKDIANSIAHLHKYGVIMVDDIELPGVSQALDEVFESRQLVPLFKGVQSVFCAHPAFKVNIDKFLDPLFRDTSDFFDWEHIAYKNLWTDGIRSKEVWIRHPEIFDQLVQIYDL